jgi:hypothetical protein
VHHTSSEATVARRRQQILATAGALALLAGPAWCADVLVGSGGERLPGKLVSQDAEWIEFDSDLLGRVRVPASRARVEQAAPDAQLASTAPAETAPAAASQEPVLSASVDALAPPDAPQDEPPVPSPAEPARAVWSRQFGLSGKNDRGTRDNPVDELELNWRVSRTLEPNKSFLELAYHYKLDNEVVKDDDWKIRLRHEREFAERRFRALQYTNASQVDDEGRRSVRILAAVTGWRLADSERLKFSLAPGYALLRGSDSEFPSASSHGAVLFTSWDWAVYRELRLSGVVTLVAELGQSDEYALETDMRLDWPITEQLGIALGWDYQRSEFEFDPGYYSRLRWLVTWKP